MTTSFRISVRATTNNQIRVELLDWRIRNEASGSALPLPTSKTRNLVDACSACMCIARDPHLVLRISCISPSRLLVVPSRDVSRAFDPTLQPTGLGGDSDSLGQKGQIRRGHLMIAHLQDHLHVGQVLSGRASCLRCKSSCLFERQGRIVHSKVAIVNDKATVLFMNLILNTHIKYSYYVWIPEIEAEYHVCGCCCRQVVRTPTCRHLDASSDLRQGCNAQSTM